MLDGQRYSFTERTDNFGRSVIMPYLPLVLTVGNCCLEVMALLDTGASVNVLPYESESRGLVVSGMIPHFPPVLLAFAWTEMRDAPVILGHMNFFQS